MPQRLSPAEPVLEIRDLRKMFLSGSLLSPAGRRVIPAVDGVSFSVPRGRTVALVGESGCGKSTLARLILRLHRPDSGKIFLLGDEVQDLRERGFRPYRRHVQMVFQNPLTSFDPRYSIGASIKEVMRLRDARERSSDDVFGLLSEVGLSPRFAHLRPRNMSGGELQRAAIARALAARPNLVVMDEPTSALDMSIQGQVLSLLRDLQERHSLSYLIATHDLRAVRMVAHDVIVMYLGQVVECGPTSEVFGHPRHPYTLGLLYAHDLEGRTTDLDRTVRIRGTLRYHEPGYQGCRLVGRCPLEMPHCREPQELEEIAPGHFVRCWRATAGYREGGATDAHQVREPSRNR
jgi:oligopeptide/dipeptide ABC transporter ATP-binding protein